MNIFVAKLSDETTNESLHSLFQPFGEVESAKVIYDRDTGMSRRFGFVEMPNEEEGVEAINALNESDFEGRNIVVKKARPREQHNNRAFSGGGGGYNRGGGYGGGYNRGGGYNNGY
ncbi:RNA-binding protein [Microscilla marina]|uniref:RNA-binding protein, RNP-1 n=1 Tax=Microscilla marina ATCC 23134 TaxID=313606 RepID=A1ZVR6_MICM2|nr:RNA-binding protein [Microscilla marina]EAY25493.1 RNA-binding protein, RNP-1 [Microscilla marina ATCC 23134]